MTFMSQYWLEFLTIATVHFFAVASPGPDFAVVLKHSIQHGRRTALITSLGIAIGIFVHVAYCLVGIALLIKTTPWIFNGLMLLAACYLLWLGFSALKSSSQDEPLTSANVTKSISNGKAFVIGFVTNGLNPKATLFFLSVFAVAVDSNTPIVVKAFYGVYMALMTGLWFCSLSYLLGGESIRRFIYQHGQWFDRIMGMVLIVLAGKLLFNSLVS